MKKLYHKIDTISGPLISLRASNIGFGEQARIHKKNSDAIPAHVIAVDGNDVVLMAQRDVAGIRTDDQIEFCGYPVSITFDKANLLGRVLSGSGTALDGRPPISYGEKISVAGHVINPIKRSLSTKEIATGMHAPLVEGQSFTIISKAGNAQTHILGRIASKVDVDIIVIGAMGIDYDDYLNLKSQLEPRRHKSIMFVHTASDPAAECLLIADMALTTAEQYALLGARVLVLLTDMTAFADALKQRGNALKKIPAQHGYPSNLYRELASRYERAAAIEGAGSITLLTVTTTTNDDVMHPVADITRSIVDHEFHGVDSLIEQSQRVAPLPYTVRASP